MIENRNDTINSLDRPIRQNLHTHSEYDDGRNPIQEMVRTAIDKGFTVLGFSGHSPNRPLDVCSMSEQGLADYLRDIKAAKEEYGDQIDLYAGIELDSLSGIDLSDFDYVIGSVHYILKDGNAYAIDESPEKFDILVHEVYQNDIQALVHDYYQSVKQMIETRPIQIVGHLDLISKYNEDERYFPFDADWFLDEAMDAVQAGIEKGLVFEMNTGAIARGYRSLPYPHPTLMKRMIEAGADRFCINSDCHDARYLDEGMDLCLLQAQSAGLKELYFMENGRLLPAPIDRFLVKNEPEAKEES